MDEARIRQLTEEVLTALAAPADPVASDLESRVAALEAALRGFTTRPAIQVPLVAAPAPAALVVAHPALRLLELACGEDRCLLEPSRPCSGSGRCRAFGH
jgi:hypothetical protein